ncbi:MULTISPECIES: histone-like nucleoid-structuring protein Lsr2 [Arthrobacter]|uniref:Lsr2 family protein n=1 Tax=Arthrobacter caoxuetaonis TaxID=2886935 RepID=A0A9X1MHG5_9MICC|nr:MULTISPECIES: Lsr2 family protein [Arthrobacter]MCC3281677.1 Lsr2 family protein [Arthrobacter caoxuetaonis]MCC3298654.1 Lsr2 family protein [Arthrobacter caoxuetaonis]MCC9194880.1 Lsr2 family protein [Arthrobacter sp. zg-Y916]USQ57391.1 Lsr2 family protein [Arthrobacter caoxuetaonis]
MAQKVKIILVDDVDGGSADETVRFGLDGSQYEIDLSTDNAKNLRAALKPYVDAGRKTGGRTGRPRGTGASRSNEAAQIREWARSNGYTVSERGRVNSEIIEAYRAAQG